jgi:diaminohydroxyphosphoribosylaminopyrimidine deaminase/5-amino-6-(5-phosphoribosylamino)uracil reductase
VSTLEVRAEDVEFPQSDGDDVTSSQKAAMRRAIAAAERVRGSTSPNPPVGCVVLDAGGMQVGVGATEPPPGWHAEVVALHQAGARARGGTAVVTLEPCAHHGRTPPCTDALMAAGIATVHYAVEDPSAAARGGAGVLRANGVAVHHGLLREEVERGQLRAWLHFTRTGTPFVTWKFAATLDGRVAAADGTSRWISSAPSRADVHAIRATVDAVVVGTGTALADDPALTVRDEHGCPVGRQPLRVVVGHRELRSDARLNDGAAPTLRLASHDPHEVLRELAARGVVDVLLEGGPTLAGAYLAAGCVHRVLGYLAPALLGDGPAALAGTGVGTIGDAIRLELEDVTIIGPDLRISATPTRRIDASTEE